MLPLPFSCGGTEGTDKQEVVVKYNAAEITEGQKITVSEFEVLGGKPTFAFKFVVTNNADKDIDMKLVETRNFDLTKYSSAVCLTTCQPGDKNKTQEWALGTLAFEEDVEVLYDLYVDDDTAAGTIPVEMSVSNGSKVVNFSIDFVYTPAAE